MKTEEARELLPWYVVGALDPAESREVASELERSADLRRELAELRALGGVVREGETEIPELRVEAIEGAWARIDAYEKTNTERPSATVTSLDSFRARVKQAWNVTPRFTKLAVAAQFAAIAVMAGLMLRAPAHEEATSVTLAGEQTIPATNGPRFDVRFAPEATEAQMRELLDRAHAQIISGPTAAQSYVVGTDSTQSPDEVLAKLRAAGDVVRFADQVQP
jgi:hypothetical protein